MDALSLKEAEDEKLIRELFVREMGFSLVVEALIEGKKPIVGHNMIYDILYLYNQFIGELPETYIEFINTWHGLFPAVYDNKVVYAATDLFNRTDLGKLYERCQTDDKLKLSGAKLEFDLENRFVNYEGEGLLSHYHEAAYDAHMTGYSFAHVLKFKEYDQGPPPSKKGGGKGGKPGA